MKRTLIVILGVLSVATWGQVPVRRDQTLALQTLGHDYWEWILSDSPELATGRGRMEFNDRWRDWSSAGRAEARRQTDAFLSRLHRINLQDLPASDRLDWQVLEYRLQSELSVGQASLLPLLSQLSSSGQIGGVQNSVFETITAMPARNVKDYENILSRLNKLPTLVDQVTGLWSRQLADGWSQPRVVVDLALDQIVAQRRAPSADSSLLAAFRKFPDGVTDEQREGLRAQAEEAYVKAFLPAWANLESYIRDRYRPRVQESVGLSNLPNGRRAYAALIRYVGDSTLSARQIHALGLQEVDRIEQAMADIARAQGFSGPVPEFEKRIQNDPAMQFTSQEDMLAFARDVLERVRPKLSQVLLSQPRMGLEIRPIPTETEAATSTYFAPGTADGSRPGRYYLNTYRPTQQYRYLVAPVALHEAMPGHYTQVGLAAENQSLKEFRRGSVSTAYREGWGLYAEFLGIELGIYRTPEERFGQLSSELYRAVRLVVDTGIHEMGWTREQARAYFAAHVPGQSLAEVDRYIANPAQALSYKIGELKIRELRTRAERELGSGFDVRAFHDAVLRNGPVTLAILESEVNAYLATGKGVAH
jgi:uncharacterized protein (DUF885 family)